VAVACKSLGEPALTDSGLTPQTSLTSYSLTGLGQGRAVQLRVNGILFEVVTTSGTTAAQVGQDQADRINDEASLFPEGVEATWAAGLLVVSNATITDAASSDPGLAISEQSAASVPTLAPLSVVILVAALLFCPSRLAGLGARRRSATGGEPRGVS